MTTAEKIENALPSLKTLFASLEGCNLNDKAITLICACLEVEIDEGGAIVATVAGMGLKSSHVGAVLRNGAGDNVERHRWRKTDAGTYALNA